MILFKVFIIFLFGTALAWGADQPLFSSYKLTCLETKFCSKVSEKIDVIEGQNIDQEKLIEVVREALNDLPVSGVYYEIVEADVGNHLNIHVTFQKQIHKIRLRSNHNIDFTSLLKVIPIKEGDYYQQEKNTEIFKVIGKFLSGKGYEDVKIEVLSIESKDGVDLDFYATIGNVVKISEVFVKTKNRSIAEISRRRFLKFKDKVWDKLEFKVEVDRLAKELFEQGYFLSQVDIAPPEHVEKGVRLTIAIETDVNYNFNFIGNKMFSRSELLDAIKKDVKGTVGELNVKQIEKSIISLYQSVGYYFTGVKGREVRGKEINGTQGLTFHLTISEGQKIPIDSLRLIGFGLVSEQQALDLYNEQATPMAARGFLDEKYLKKYVDLLKVSYLSRGYAWVNIAEPEVEINQEDRTASVRIKVREGIQTNLTTIEINGVTKELASEIRDQLKNRENDHLNLTAIQSDLEMIIKFLGEQGFYYAEVVNLDQKVVEYSEDMSHAKLVFNIRLERKTLFDGMAIVGNARTKTKVIEREVRLAVGETITPRKLEQIRERLGSLGLFSSIKITPLVINGETPFDREYRAHLLIQVQEKDFGLIEIAPGFRTDIGIKLSTGVSYLNLGGMNRSMALKAQTNQRLDYNSLDERRQAERKRRLEYVLDADFAEPYLFGKRYAFDFNNSFSRRRFFGFDADIVKTSSQITKTWGEHFSSSLKYSLEIIEQFDATEIKDKGYFRIGSITPGFVMDYRDNRVNPSKGVYSSLTWEFANPYFYSMSNDNLEINFHKITLRNKFYIPVSKVVVALSLSGGVQVNLANDVKYDSGVPMRNEDGSERTKGYIPSIKLFRLDGADLVRGFADDEINRIRSGEDISSLIIQDRAYFLNFKFEPRYNLTENVIGGLFYDAGRVYVTSIQPFDLRSSVGASIKYLTPVGTLDFDYGVKLHRRDVGGKRESQGRFHLSIGFF